MVKEICPCGSLCSWISSYGIAGQRDFLDVARSTHVFQIIEGKSCEVKSCFSSPRRQVHVTKVKRAYHHTSQSTKVLGCHNIIYRAMSSLLSQTLSGYAHNPRQRRMKSSQKITTPSTKEKTPKRNPHPVHPRFNPFPRQHHWLSLIEPRCISPHSPSAPARVAIYVA